MLGVKLAEWDISFIDGLSKTDMSWDWLISSSNYFFTIFSNFYVLFFIFWYFLSFIKGLLERVIMSINVLELFVSYRVICSHLFWDYIKWLLNDSMSAWLFFSSYIYFFLKIYTY